VSFLRRAFEQRDLVSATTHLPGAAMGTGYTVPSNADGAVASAGIPVNDRSALGVTAYNACVQLIADSIASMPWDSYRKGPDGRRVEVSPQSSLLREPSPEMSVFDWKHMLTVSLLMRGNFYGLVGERDVLGYPTIIQPIHPDSVQIDRDPDTFRKRVRVNGKLTPERDLFHIPAFRLPGMDTGLSPIGMARHSLGLSLAAQEYGAKWFADGAAPSSVLETDANLTDDQVKRVQRGWIASHGGRRRPAVLSGGFKWKPITITPEESQFLQTRQHQALEACQILRVPPHMVAIVDKSTSWGTGIEQQSIGFVTYTLRSWLTRIESAMDRVSPRGQFTKFNVDGLLRGDIKARYEAYRVALDGGFRNPDEVRALEDLPPIPGGAGQGYRQPMNFAPLGYDPATAVQPEPAATPPEEGF
jgi:HK97 family phage portal protein